MVSNAVDLKFINLHYQVAKNKQVFGESSHGHESERAVSEAVPFFGMNLVHNNINKHFFLGWQTVLQGSFQKNL